MVHQEETPINVQITANILKIFARMPQTPNLTKNQEVQKQTWPRSKICSEIISHSRVLTQVTSTIVLNTIVWLRNMHRWEIWATNSCQVTLLLNPFSKHAIRARTKGCIRRFTTATSATIARSSCKVLKDRTWSNKVSEIFHQPCTWPILKRMEEWPEARDTVEYIQWTWSW